MTERTVDCSLGSLVREVSKRKGKESDRAKSSYGKIDPRSGWIRAI